MTDKAAFIGPVGGTRKEERHTLWRVIEGGGGRGVRSDRWSVKYSGDDSGKLASANWNRRVE